MKKKFSLRIQIVLIIVIFMLSVLGLIYFFQTTLLDDFYKNNKIASMEETAHNISSNLKDEDLRSVLNNETISNEVCVRIISNSINVVGYNDNNACALGQLNERQIINIAKEVSENNNQKLFNNYRFEMYPGNAVDIYIYGEMTNINNEDVLVLVSSNIVPLGATVKTISDQYLIIALIVVATTIVLAFILSRYIVKPIKEIEDEAKDLPLGEYETDKIRVSNLEMDSLNQTLGKANEQIKKADKAKKELIGNVSHDLRTPLTMIVGYGEMIRDLPEENNEENINIIIDEAKRLSTLVDDLLDLSKVESGKINLDIKETSINNLLEAVYKQYDNYCKTQGVNFELKTIEDKLVKVDEHRIKQVLYNFINNALNYNNKEDKHIILGSEEHEDKYRIYVYDNGQGIGKEDLKHIWDRYYKVDKEHKRAHLGSGIGLSLSRDLLKAHNIEYGVESKEGEYSKFYFDI